ncbi:MAG: energy transducer TonB [Candidatus Polarisedimenticolaceae bacterium]|nr:energy transducer TonB [Candidatus Polarisedimenticolaceae bacterium]
MSRPAIISSFDRLGLTLFFAVSLHITLILGVGFEAAQPKPQAAARTLEVMVVHNARKPKEPDEADFLAQTDQQGGGKQQEITKPTIEPIPPKLPVQPAKSPLETAVAPASAAPLTAEPEPTPEPTAPTPQPSKKLVTKKASKTTVDSASSPKPQEAAKPKKRKRLSISQLLASSNQEIKRISAELDRKTKAYAKRPRRKAINASTKEYKYATYLDAWRRKVERVGNLNYPDEAKRKKLYGNLVLHVAVRADGSIDSLRILHSSGHKLLDDAAVRIVKLAAPFAPFPPDILNETDILDITRTWRFLSSNRLGWKK